MANTVVSGANVAKLTKNTAVAAPAGQAVTTGNVAVLTPASGESFRGRYVLVEMVESGSVPTSTATVKVGDIGQDIAYGDGTAVTFASGQTKVLCLDLARFGRKDGTIQVAVGGTSGSVTFRVYDLDRHAA